MRSRLIFLLLLVFTTPSFGARYRKAVETKDNVKNKRYPKRKKIELNLDGGGIINQSYTDTISFHASLNYFFSEVWGLGLDFTYNINTDRGERYCIENFFNRPPGVGLEKECLTADGIEFDGSIEEAQRVYGDATGEDADKTTLGPAYVPIREKDMTIGLNLVWNPVYGKQLFFGTGWFDLFVTMGLGVSFNQYYGKKYTFVKDNVTRNYRGDFDDNPGVDVNEPNAEFYIGTAGRPPVQNEVTGHIVLGVGQRYHFLKYFHFNVEIRNYTLLGATDSFIDNYFSLYGGIGVRL